MKETAATSEYLNGSNEFGHDPRAVANYFISKLNNDECTDRVTPLSLQKLLYIANALCLLDLDTPLINELPKVGQFDPYFPTLRNSLFYFGGNNLRQEIPEGTDEDVYSSLTEQKIFQPITSNFSKEECEILDSVWNLFLSVDCDCTRLTYLTGGDRNEFKQMTTTFGKDHEITEDYIKETLSERLLNPKHSEAGYSNRECAA